MPREIVVDWTTPAGNAFANVMFFDTAGSVGTQRLALNAMLSSYDGSVANTCSWSIRNSGRELSDSTGTLTGSWSAGLNYSGTSGVAADPVPDSTQVLFQWDTGQIVNGRFLRGRTFLPGIVVSNVDQGNLDPAVAGGFEGYMATFISAADGFGVWHRPQGGAGGLFQQAVTGTCWEELAVLRRRRR